MKIIEDIGGLFDFLKDNPQLFKKPNKKYKADMDFISNHFSTEFPYGQCFPVSQFVFYLLGGYEGNYQLNCIHKIPMEIGGKTFYTSHWFVSNKNHGDIIDLTKKQFDGILDIKEYYAKGRKANFGFPYLKKGEKRFETTVPCSQVLKIYELYRETYGTRESFEEFYQEKLSYEK